MNVKEFVKSKETRHHVRLNTKNCVKITTPRMDLILKIVKLKGTSLSEFCKMAALKEARFELMRFRKDKVEMAKRILKDEEDSKI